MFYYVWAGVYNPKNKMIQDNLPGFDCAYAEADAMSRERGIPDEIRNAWLNKMHWKFRKYAEVCRHNREHNMQRAQQIVFLACKQR